MKPKIDNTNFGSITVEAQSFDHDIIIRLNGEVKKRKKKLSKKIYGSSHTISFDEAEYTFEKGADTIVIGSGQYGMIKLSSEAKSYFQMQECKIELMPTPQAIKKWNDLSGKVIGLFHITC